jgi:hypothetical protein
MKRLVLGLAVLALATTPTFAADTAKQEDVYIEGVPGSYQDDYGRGNALVASIIQATFTDLGPAYVAALDAGGMSTDLIYDPMGAWPPMDDYCLVLVTTSDMWWTYFWEYEDPILDAYMAAGGTCILVGQDYLYTRLSGINGFPMDWLGVTGANQDVNWADEWVDWEGTPGGPLDGMTGYVVYCFTDNPFFTDEIFPAVDGVCWWTSATIPFPLEGGSAIPVVSCFSTVEFACQPQNELDAVVAAMLRYLGSPTPTETTTWGAVKGMFR